MKIAAIGVLLLCLGCQRPISNDAAIAEVKKCEAAGMKAAREVNAQGETLAIFCVPKDEK